MRFVTLGLVLSTVAHAAPAIALKWQAPAECPSAESVLREVARLEGTHQATSSELTVSVVVQHQPTAWAAELTTDANGATGERSFSAPDCRQLADAAALIIALAHCPDLLSAEPEPVAAEPPPSRFSVSVGAFAAGDLGSLPGPSFGAGGTVGLRIDRFGLEVLALRTLSRHSTSGPVNLEVQAQLGLGARGCWYALDGRVILAPCVGVDGWLISTTTSGITAPSTGTGWWVGVTAGGLIGIRLFERLAVIVGAEAGAAATRPVFVVDGYGQVHRPGEFVGRVRGGLEVRLW